MKISLVMAVLDGARYLDQALDSAVNQTRPPEEIIVVDGGSSDGSAAIAGRYPSVTLITQRGATGFAGAWDEGIAQATGDALALLDSDDRWTPGKLAAQSAILEENPQLEYVLGQVRHFLEPACDPPSSFRAELLEENRMAPMPGTTLFRRRAYDRVGPWSRGYSVAADIDWFVRAKDLLPPPGLVEELVLYKRVHDANISLFKARTLNAEILSLVRESVGRRR